MHVVTALAQNWSSAANQTVHTTDCRPIYTYAIYSRSLIWNLKLVWLTAYFYGTLPALTVGFVSPDNYCTLAGLLGALGRDSKSRTLWRVRIVSA